MRICFADVFFAFFVFFVFLTAERIFMKLLPNERGGGCSLKRRAAAWRMANVDDLHNLRYDSFTVTRGRHARRLRYTTMSGRIDVI